MTECGSRQPSYSKMATCRSGAAPVRACELGTTRRVMQAAWHMTHDAWRVARDKHGAARHVTDGRPSRRRATS